MTSLNPDRSADGARFLRKELSWLSSICSAVDTPRSLTVDILARYGEFEQLANLECNPFSYTEKDTLKFRDDYLVSSVMLKNPRLPLGINTKRVAMRKWIECERSCLSINQRFSGCIYDLTKLPSSETIEPLVVINRARDFISRVLGQLNRKALVSIEDGCRFGPGRTTHLKGMKNRRSKKYASRIYGCTPSLTCVLPLWPSVWRTVEREFDVVKGNIVSFVPKNAKTDRPIAFEPDVNIYWQLGLGSYLKKRLKIFGFDTSDQSINQRRAEHALKHDLCTIDLSSASDTISFEVVRLLLPTEWFDLFALFRSPKSYIKGQWVDLQKFSSMGNGFTFELETLIFASLCYAAGSSDFTVYGDDIIAENSSYTKIVECLEYLGFKTNEKKSFNTGLFRESCGSDFFNGIPVRPFFFRKSLKDATFDEICYLSANSISHYSGNLFDYLCRDSRYLPVWLRIYSSVNAARRYRIPKGFADDGGFAVCRSESKQGWGNFRYLHRRTKKSLRDELGGYIAQLDKPLVDTTSSRREPYRARENHSSTRRGHVFTWPWLGPWV